MKFSNKTYDILKEVALVWLPALGALYFAVAQIWHLPSAEEVLGTITAVDTFLGVVLHISNNAYQRSVPVDGVLNIDKSDPAKDNWNLVLNNLPENIENSKTITLGVKRS